MTEFNESKTKNQEVEGFSKVHLTEKGHRALTQCWSWVDFAVDSAIEKRRVYAAPSCHKRVCIICSARAAYQSAIKLDIMIQWLKNERKQEFIFTTCSAPSVKGNELSAEVDRINAGLKRLYETREVKAATNGFVRKIEFTYNAEKYITLDMWEGKGRYKGKPMEKYFTARGLKVGDVNPNFDTYHLHVHTLWAVDKRYFKGKGYIKQSRWLELWQRSIREEKPPHFHVQKFREHNEKKSEILEIAKYSAKAADLTHSQEVFSTLYEVMYKRLLMTFGGVFREAATLYKEFQKSKKGDKPQPHLLDKYARIDTTEYVYMQSFKWAKNEYKEQTLRRLTELEQEYLRREDVADDMELED